MNNLRAFFGPMRPPFLVLAPACVLLGVATAGRQGGDLNALDLGLVFLGGLLAHIAVNVFNEVFDYKTGLDERTERTPFSGGSGALPQRPDLLRPVLASGVAAVVLVALIGVYFVIKRGWGLLPVGLLGLLLTYAYTAWMIYNPVACLVAPGLGFGIFMVMGVHYALGGGYTWLSFVAALIPFFLVDNLLFLNQFPDVEADSSIGKKHIPLLWGRKRSSLVFGLFMLVAYLVIILAVVFGVFPVWCLLGLLTAAFALPAAWGAYRNAENIPALLPSLGMNVLVNVLTPVLVAIGLFVG